jgi:uncharacterized protein (TIGR02611 family)
MSAPASMPGLATLSAWRDAVRRLPGGRIIWRIGVTFVGVLIVAVGLLLVPLPGPGWLIVFLGLGVLATEYAWARRLLAVARRFVGDWWRWISRQSRLIRIAIGVLGLAFTAAVSYACWELL